MDDETRASAQTKLDRLKFIIGSPKWTNDTAAVSEFHKDLFFDNSYFNNAGLCRLINDLVAAQAFNEFSMAKRALQARGGWIRDEMLFGYPWQVNAFHLTGNLHFLTRIDLVQVQINTGILQAPLFSHHHLAASNYGSLGMIVGHEVTHAFDSIGKKLNQDGVKETWWTESSDVNFGEHAQCFVNQYNDMQVELTDQTLLSINGKKTLSENIADNGGLHVAYNAWIKHMARKTDIDITDYLQDYGDGTSMTNERLFFVSFAQTWCGVARDAQIEVCLRSCLMNREWSIMIHMRLTLCG